MILKFNNQVIKYEIDRANRKNIYICIKDGNVIIKGPKKMSDKMAEEIVEKKKEWILKKIVEEKKSSKYEKENEFLKNEKYYKELAKERISNIMENMINFTGLKPVEYKLVNLKRSWGNCSSKKVIKLNNKLVMYSDFAIQYVCIHELCHLKYMNHSKDFWSLVKSYMPNYKEIEKELH